MNILNRNFIRVDYHPFLLSGEIKQIRRNNIGSLLVSMWNWLWYGLGGAGLVSVLLYTFQDYLLYFPTIENSRTVFIQPQAHGLADVFEEHFLSTPDGVTLNLWLFRQETENRPTLLFFHGNAGSRYFSSVHLPLSKGM